MRCAGGVAVDHGVARRPPQNSRVLDGFFITMGYRVGIRQNAAWRRHRSIGQAGLKRRDIDASNNEAQPHGGHGHPVWPNLRDGIRPGMRLGARCRVPPRQGRRDLRRPHECRAGKRPRRDDGNNVVGPCGKSKLRRPAPSTRSRPLDRVCAVAWRFDAIDATLSPSLSLRGGVAVKGGLSQ